MSLDISEGDPASRAAGAPVDRSTDPLARLQRVLHARPILGPLAVLVLSVIAFALLTERFLSVANLSLVLAQVTVIAMLALGQTLVILTAGIDLSVGAIAVFSSIVMAVLATRLGVPGPVALLLGLVLGTAMGTVNGVLVTRVGLPPFIVTLGTLSVFFSLNNVVSRSETVRGSDMPDILTWTGGTFAVGDLRVTYGSLLMLAASPNVGLEYNLDSITAVVLRGTSLFGGRGLVLGTLVGALIVGVFRSGLQLAGVDVVWQGTAIGLLVLVAVAIDQWIRKVRA